MMNCSSCHSSCTKVIESRLCINGTRRRRHHCLNCGHRWTSWDGPRPDPSEHMTPLIRRRMQMPKRLTDDEVRMILERRNISARRLANDLGRSAEAICQVRAGISYRNVLPEIPRWGARKSMRASCHACVHWRSRCVMGFPDPEEEGPGFAADCSLFEQRPAATV